MIPVDTEHTVDNGPYPRTDLTAKIYSKEYSSCQSKPSQSNLHDSLLYFVSESRQ